ncbi:MAG: hypothetical protein GY859_00770 [Desulfobacterales bacterium]|nr:hypothetical protein [Desulfobacterales bacterium]
MIKRLFIILLLSLICHGPVEAAWEVVVVQSIEIRPYNLAADGFRETCRPANIGKVVLADVDKPKAFKKLVRKKPDLVMAVGRDALAWVSDLKHVTVVYVLVLKPDVFIGERDDVTGIDIEIGPEKQLETIRNVLPGLENIGVLFNPANSGEFIRKALEASRFTKLNVMAREIFAPMQFSRRLNNMRGSIDAFWMVPDVTAITPETMEFLLNFSLEHRVPIISFSDKYIKMGALMSIGLDPYDIGAQAGEMAKRILTGVPPWDVPHEEPRKTMVTLNMKMAGKFGVRANTRAVEGVYLRVLGKE